ncbi:MAG: hypothetical protein JNJ61_30440 [Anaerolineae bacterium]|nr:hypothetical protein [Anaerolineae bacterium]
MNFQVALPTDYERLSVACRHHQFPFLCFAFSNLSSDVFQPSHVMDFKGITLLPAKFTFVVFQTKDKFSSTQCRMIRVNIFVVGIPIDYQSQVSKRNQTLTSIGLHLDTNALFARFRTNHFVTSHEFGHAAFHLASEGSHEAVPHTVFQLVQPCADVV